MNYIFANTNPTDNQFNEILKNYILPISIGVACLIFIVVLALFIIALVKGKKKNNITDKAFLPSNEIINALGNKENIISSSLKGSRLTLVLKDYNIINESKLNELGIDSIIKMSNKIILVSKDDLAKIYKDISN